VGPSVAMGACVVVGVGVVVVGDGVGLADVGDGDGDGLVVPGDGDGDGLGDAGDGDELADAGEGDTLPLGKLPGLADVAFVWDADGLPESAGLALPLVPPDPPDWLELLVPDGLPLVRPIFCWICPRAKTPATTRTTAPATARAGRNQAIAGPTDMRRGAPALRGRFAEAQAAMPPRTGSDRSRPPPPAGPAAVASSAVASPAPPDRTVLNQD
jgi:hypothetical protein